MPSRNEIGNVIFCHYWEFFTWELSNVVTLPCGNFGTSSLRNLLVLQVQPPAIGEKVLNLLCSCCHKVLDISLKRCCELCISTVQRTNLFPKHSKNLQSEFIHFSKSGQRPVVEPRCCLNGAKRRTEGRKSRDSPP
jgi:hypothetical protein